MMARFSLFALTATLLIGYVIGFSKEALPLAQGLARQSAHNMLRQVSMRMPAEETPFTGRFKGVYKQWQSTLKYSGNYRGVAVGKSIDAEFDSVATGIYKMMGWDGIVNGDLRGTFKASAGPLPETGKAVIDARFNANFNGEIEGMPSNMRANGTSMLSSTATAPGKISVKATEKADYSGNIGDKQVTGMYTAMLTDDMFSLKTTGLVDGKKFEFMFSGKIEDLFSFMEATNIGTYEITVEGKTTKGSYKFKGIEFIME